MLNLRFIILFFLLAGPQADGVTMHLNKSSIWVKKVAFCSLALGSNKFP